MATRVRATVLLKSVSLAMALGVFALLVLFVESRPLDTAGVALLASAWVVGIEFGVIPAILDHVVTRRASYKGGPSLWFVEPSTSQAHAEREDAATRDNAAL